LNHQINKTATANITTKKKRCLLLGSAFWEIDV
jgi:hypothetical protein